MTPDIDRTTEPVVDAAVIGGTLCLMSCFAQHAHPAYAARIASNLDRLAASPAVSAELRTVCRRLAERWHVFHAEAVERSVARAPDDARTLQ